jgi:glycosyltransferase involved in cell wall biosynthesis
MTEPLVSVLTPVHNGSEFLHESIESVLAQTHRNFILRVIDNCSTDGTPEIVESFARRDSRVVLERHETFVGAAENHNRAFRSAEAESEFIKVVQADDTIFPTCLSRMVSLAHSFPTVGVVSGYRLKGSEVDLVGLPYPESFARGKSILRQSLLGGPYVTGSPTSLLYRSELVRRRDPFYDIECEICDADAAYWAFAQSDFALVHEIMTYSRRQPGSRIAWSYAVASVPPELLRMLLKYGPLVLSEEEFRGRLRHELSQYVWFHLKQRLRPSRWRQKDFHRFHRRMTRRIKEESRGDREVAGAMAVVDLLLNRVEEGARPEPGATQSRA